MAAVFEPALSIEPIEGEAQQRRVRVSYVLDLDTDEFLVTHGVDEFVRVHGVDEHDAAVRPDRRPIAETRSTFRCRPGRNARSISVVVNRSALDVQQDWWSAGSDGETQPIAEWSDHIAADIVLSRSGRVVATDTTPTITGSWGVLAADEPPTERTTSCTSARRADTEPPP